MDTKEYGNYLIPALEPERFKFFKDEEIIDGKGRLGISHNRILEIPNFISESTAESLVSCFKDDKQVWLETAFNGSLGFQPQYSIVEPSSYGLPNSIFQDINAKLRHAVATVYNKDVVPSSIHVQKWDVGSSASPHSDNSDFDGNPTEGFDNLKYVGILYLNSDYSGGNLYFPEHNIDIHPNAGSMYIFSGGVENIHGVTEITSGTRYSIVSFWDF